jgi:hypothetical protein
MRFPMRDRRRLRRIGTALRDSDPRLAAMLKTFSKLAEGDPMPGHERLPARDSQPWDGLMRPRRVHG